jgi:hypothetical protein
MAYYIGKQSRDQRAIDAAHCLSDFVNDMTRDEELFLTTMSREHRTLQQSFTGLCFAWIRKCAEKAESGDFDGRNEYSVEKCKEVLEKVELLSPPLI